MNASATEWAEREIGRVVAYVDRSERHRVGLVIGVTLLVFLIAVVRSPFGGLVPLAFTVVLVLFLYTRPSARATVTASATGPGFVFLALFRYRVIGPFGWLWEATNRSRRSSAGTLGCSYSESHYWSSEPGSAGSRHDERCRCIGVPPAAGHP